MSLTARVDKDLCMSSGTCVTDHPEAFRFDDDQIAETTPAADTQPDDVLRDAAQRCPAGAILLTDEAGTPVDPFEPA